MGSNSQTKKNGVKLPHYLIEWDNNRDGLERLQESVNQWLAEGYELVGGPIAAAFSSDPESEYTIVLQALIKKR